MYASIQIRIGDAHSQLGQLDAALAWYHRARTVYEKLDRTTTTDFGTLLNNMGSVYRQKTISQKH